MQLGRGGGTPEPRRSGPAGERGTRGGRRSAGGSQGRPKAAAFFCENCGMPVRLKDSVCPHCGRWFSAARCPECGFVGEPKLFGDGCPACGYLKGEEEALAVAGGSKRQSGTKERGGIPPEASGAAARTTGGMPAWVYTVAALVLLAALLLFVVIILRSR